MGQYNSKKTISFLFMFIILLSLISPLLMDNRLNDFSIDPVTNIIQNDDISPNTSDLSNRIKFDYTPIDSLSDSGDSLVIDDNLSVIDPLNITLDANNGYNDSYTITTLAGYSVDNLQYNLTLESAVDQDVYQETTNKLDALASTRIRYAFKFDVSQSYAIFKGAQIWL